MTRWRRITASILSVAWAAAPVLAVLVTAGRRWP
jgi:hypothetical protein